MNIEKKADFNALTPDRVLDAVEQTMGLRCGSFCRPMNSYINRVYEVDADGGQPLIAKFYRPGRWTRTALQDEVDFILDLAAAEIPVIPPLLNSENQALHEWEGMYFSVFPKKGGRICDEPNEEQWVQLGRLLGRVHQVGSVSDPRERIELGPENTEEQLEEILASGLLPDPLMETYEDLVLDVLDLIDPVFMDLEGIRIHGDCHHQNIIFRPGESFYIIDFDDMAMGPPVQDLWMLLPGRVTDSRRELDLFLSGYELFRPFAYDTLRLVEPLRALRYIHFTAWCARQVSDSGFSRMNPEWGTERYWNNQLRELSQQMQEIQIALS